MVNGMTEFRPFENTVERVLTALNQSTSGISNPEQWLIEALTGSRNENQIPVTEYSALGWPPLWATVSRISGHVATMPLEIKRETEDGGFTKVKDPRNQLWESPNNWQTGSTLKELMQMNALLHGNGRALIVRDSTGMPIELVPLLAFNTRTVLVEGEKFHWVIAPQFWNYSLGVLEPGRSFHLHDDDVLHIPGLGGNGAWGYSIIHMFRESIGLGLSGQAAALQSFNNMGRPGIILEAPIGKFRDPKKADDFLKQFDASQAGIDNSGKTAMLREGVQAKILSMNHEDSQFLDQRKFQRDDAQLIMFLEILMGEKGPYKSITEKNTQYMINCLSRWIVKWEQECDRKLRTEQEKLENVLKFKFDPTFLVTGDPISLAIYTGKLREQGAMSGNEVRRKHNLPKIDDPALETFSNPNTTPGEAPDEDKDNDKDRLENDDRLEKDKLRDVARNAIGSRIKRVAGAEIDRVQRAARKGKNTLKTIETFYDKFESDLGDAVKELGGDPEDAYKYVSESMGQIRDIAAVTDTSQLPSAISGLVTSAAWNDRADQLTDRILQGACHV